MKLSVKQADVQARREKYYQSRRDGLDMWAAGLAAGLDDQSTIKRYERWWKEIGQRMPPEEGNRELQGSLREVRQA